MQPSPKMQYLPAVTTTALPLVYAAICAGVILACCSGGGITTGLLRSPRMMAPCWIMHLPPRMMLLDPKIVALRETLFCEPDCEHVCFQLVGPCVIPWHTTHRSDILAGVVGLHRAVPGSHIPRARCVKLPCSVCQVLPHSSLADARELRLGEDLACCSVLDDTGLLLSSSASIASIK